MTKTKERKTKLAEPRERIVNNDPKLLESFDVGAVTHQGDIIIVGISILPGSAKPRKDRQLAIGDTQGSRHVLKRGDVYDANASEVAVLIARATKCEVPTKYIGPVFVSPAEPSEHDLIHPEHGHLGFPSGQVCAVVYQRNLDSMEREARVED